MEGFVCPSCQAMLSVPRLTSPDGHGTCYRCGHRVRFGEIAPPADRAPVSYWDQVELPDLPAGVERAEPSAGEPAQPAAGTATSPPMTVPNPRPRLRRGWRIAAAALGAGLVVGGAVALPSVRRPVPVRAPATPPPAAPLPTAGPSPAHAQATLPPTPVTPPSAAPVVAEAPPSPPAARPTRAPEPPAWAFDRWLQDFDRARQLAGEQGKDVLLLFDSSDWSDFSLAMAREVFARPALWERITERFVPVHVDFPEYPKASRRVQDPARNEALQARFFKHPAYPRMVLTDPEGRPYAVEWGYDPGQAEAFVGRLEAHRQRREDRDELLAAVEAAGGEEKLRAAEAALRFLANEVEGATPRDDGTFALGLETFYAPLLARWRALAGEHDPANAGGYVERSFRADWGRRFGKAVADPGARPAVLRGLAEEFDAWRAPVRFHDPDVAADLLSSRARLATALGDPKGAEREARAALALGPSPGWRRVLSRSLPSDPGPGHGTGFAVAPGYVVTNRHVVEGLGEVWVKVAGREPVAGEVVATDEASDLALVKVALPPRAGLTPLRVAPGAAAGRGTEVMALGYALGGAELKFTRGSVSARQDLGGGPPYLLLDQRVNPGNSGGPLFDACGNVVGVVTAKTISTTAVDSYGVAVGAEALDRFLARHLGGRGYRPSPPLRQRYDWAALDRYVSPSVVQVLRPSQ